MYETDLNYKTTIPQSRIYTYANLEAWRILDRKDVILNFICFPLFDRQKETGKEIVFLNSHNSFQEYDEHKKYVELI